AASCNASLDPKSVAMPLLLMPRSVASLPMLSRSRPSTEATSAARRAMAARERAPLARRWSEVDAVMDSFSHRGVVHTNGRSYVLFRRFPARSRHRLPTLHPLATRSPCHEESPMSLVSEHTDSSPPPKLARRTLLLACGAAFLAFLDLSVVNIAFPSLARD